MKSPIRNEVRKWVWWNVSCCWYTVVFCYSIAPHGIPCAGSTSQDSFCNINV